MAKANLCFNRIGNDGYKYARRTDGKWFVKENYFRQGMGWTSHPWAEVNMECHSVIETCMKAYESGATCTHVGFGHLVVFTDGAGLRLPKIEA